MVFEFEFEPRTGCVVLLSLVEHVTDVGLCRFGQEERDPVGRS